MSSEGNSDLDVLIDLVVNAREALDVDPPEHAGRSMRWAESDFRSLEAAMDLESFIACNGISLRLFIGAEHDLADHLTDWRKALPFSERERARIVEARQEHLDEQQTRLATIVRREVGFGSVEDVGITSRIGGKHLMQTWWQWRRAFGERFEEQRGVERASRSLMLARLVIEQRTAR